MVLAQSYLSGLKALSSTENIPLVSDSCSCIDTKVSDPRLVANFDADAKLVSQVGYRVQSLLGLRLRLTQLMSTHYKYQDEDHTRLQGRIV